MRPGKQAESELRSMLLHVSAVAKLAGPLSQIVLTRSKNCFHGERWLHVRSYGTSYKTLNLGGKKILWPAEVLGIRKQPMLTMFSGSGSIRVFVYSICKF